MDYEEMMLQISDVMRHANRLRPLITHEEAVKAIRNIVAPEPSSCELQEFGKCSYKETGCSDCYIKERIRKALDEKCYEIGHADGARLGYEKGLKDARPKGKWVESPYEELRKHGYFKCSNCGVGFKRFDKEYQCYDNFCPNCGADMRGDV